MKTERRKIRDKLELAVKKAVKERDNYTCQKCGKVVSGSNCHASHVIPVSRSLRLSFDLQNLKVLCFRHHINWWHKHPIESGAWFKEKFPERMKYLDERMKELVTQVKTYEMIEWLEALK